MEIEKIHESFEKKIAVITSYQRGARSLAKAELAKLVKFAKNEEWAEKGFDTELGWERMVYRNPISGEQTTYAATQSTVDLAIQSIALHQNKQYQWLLAEAYEEFEDFIEMAYASAGYKGHTFWPLSDFGNIYLSDIALKD